MALTETTSSSWLDTAPGEDLTPVDGARILLVEDNEDFAIGIEAQLRAMGHHPTRVGTFRDAVRVLRERAWDLLVLDLTLPDAEAEETIRGIRSLDLPCPIIVLTGRNEAKMAVAAMRMGVEDYLTKPVRHAELRGAVDKGLHHSKLRHLIAEHREADEADQTQVIGESTVWLRTMDTLEAVASSASTSVLLTGESGVGKEVAAHIVHQRSPRSEGAFVTLNVACLPENLVESELFGHEAGAFTGAQKRKRGVFELADDGTLFLDEIGELPTSMQAKLLRVLEGHPFRRLGGEEEIQPNFRLVTATNRDLSALVEAGDFRQDLYHRLRILEVELPPLRERSGDIKKLALYFLAVLGDRLGRPDVTLTAEALECLENYTWPGNIRELRNVIERALVLTQEGPIRPESFPAEVVEASPRDLDSTSELVFEDDDESDAAIEYRLREEDWELDTLIHLHIQRVLEHCDGNITRAAEKLGITRQTVRRRLDRYEEN